MSDKRCRYSDVSAEFIRTDEEDKGTKDKFWLARRRDGARFLFKIGHIDSEGNAVEHWAEAAAAELCEKLSIPCASYRLAIYNGQRGTISRDFRRLQFPDGEKASAGFVMANQVFKGMRIDYPAEERYGVREYTVGACVRLLKGIASGTTRHNRQGAATSMPGLFCGYLMLDALIANSDRHHENWGFIVARREETLWLELAPTFDHAASFCREPARKVRERLGTRDGNRTVEAFCRSAKARSAFFGRNGIPLSPLEAFAEAGRLDPRNERGVWLDNLRKLNPRRDLTFAFGDGCGADVVAPESREFALRMVEVNRKRLLDL